MPAYEEAAAVDEAALRAAVGEYVTYGEFTFTYEQLYYLDTTLRCLIGRRETVPTSHGILGGVIG